MPEATATSARLSAFDVETMKETWSIEQRAPFLTAVLSTAGRLAFVGDLDRHFKAVDVKNGKVLWETRLGASARFPCLSPPGASSISRSLPALVAAAPGMSTGDTPDITIRRTVTLYVFALPGSK
jgi:alcohol dehydrogenase (cytochrome c)